MQDRPLVVAGLTSDALEKLTATIRNISHIKAVTDEISETPKLCAGVQNPIVVLGIGDKNAAGINPVVAELKRMDVPVIAIGVSKDADLILRALRAGVSEFVVSNDDDDLLRAIVRLSHPKADGGSGKITAIVPAKGGVGTTAIATNLAGVLQASKARTCLLDLDLHFGDVLSFLDISSAYAISDLIANMRRLDAELLESSLTRHASGVSVLAQSHRIDEAESINVDSVSSMLAFLRQHFDSVIVDGIRGFTEMSLAALDACDVILLVCTQDVPAVRNARRCVEIFNQLGYAVDKTHVVLNRFNKRSQIDLTVVEETIGLPVAACVANDFPSIIRSINTGVMLSEVAPRSKLAEDIAALAAIVRGDGARKQGKRGLLGGLFSGKVEAHGA